MNLKSFYNINMKTNRYKNILCNLPLIANRGNINNHHAAFVLNGKKQVSSGFNRTSGINPIHAEIDAIMKYLIQKGVYKQCILWN